jgi:hypothetical protein
VKSSGAEDGVPGWSERSLPDVDIGWSAETILVDTVRMACLADIVFDCAHPAALARFWAASLDGYAVAAYDVDELERLRSIGIEDPEEDPSVLVVATSDRPRLWFQRVPEPKQSKNRVHLDLRADDLDREVTRLTALGATVLSDQPRADLVVMRDPEGNEFCVLAP